MNVNRDTAAGLGGSCLFDRVIWSWCFLGIVASLDVLEFGFAEDDVLLVDGGSFTVWKVGTKTVVMTIFLLGHLEEKHGKTKTNRIMKPCRWIHAAGDDDAAEDSQESQVPQKPARHGGDCRLVAIGFLSVEAFHLQLSIFSKIVPVSSLASEPPVNHQWTQSSVHSLFDFPGGPEAYSLATGRARTKVWSFQDEKHHMTCASGASGFLRRFRSFRKSGPGSNQLMNFARQTHIKPAFAERGSPFAEIIRSSMALCTGWTADWSFWLIWMRWPIGHV